MDIVLNIITIILIQLPLKNDHFFVSFIAIMTKSSYSYVVISSWKRSLNSNVCFVFEIYFGIRFRINLCLCGALFVVGDLLSFWPMLLLRNHPKSTPEAPRPWKQLNSPSDHLEFNPIVSERYFIYKPFHILNTLKKELSFW